MPLKYFKNCRIIICMKKSYQISHNRENNTGAIYFHSHDFYEIYFFVDGNVKYYIENESYDLTKGDVLIIPPGKLHRPVIEENTVYERYVLWLYGVGLLSNEGIGTAISEINKTVSEKKTRLASFKDAEYSKLKELLEKLICESVSDEKLSFYTAESCIVLALGDILRKLQHTENTDWDSGHLAGRVISYINRNVAAAPSLDELSEKFFVSKYYLSRKFKEYTKTTIHQYILMKKINLAKQLLESGRSPQETCYACGFSTYSNFYKVFTGQTGISPGNYARKTLGRE